MTEVAKLSIDEMKKVVLKPGIHKGIDVIILEFTYDRELIDLVKINP